MTMHITHLSWSIHQCYGSRHVRCSYLDLGLRTLLHHFDRLEHRLDLLGHILLNLFFQVTNTSLSFSMRSWRPVLFALLWNKGFSPHWGQGNLCLIKSSSPGSARVVVDVDSIHKYLTIGVSRREKVLDLFVRHITRHTIRPNHLASHSRNVEIDLTACFESSQCTRSNIHKHVG
jgi:hypothetical protein